MFETALGAIAAWLAGVGITGDSAFAAVLGYWAFLKIAIIVTAVLITLSSIDDLFIDILYWWRSWERIWDFWGRPPKQALLDRHPEKLIAIMVPAWQESDVIASMVANTNQTFDYARYRIFVGAYANDPDTAREVDKIRQRFPNTYRAEVPHDGPTSKADCLNWLVQNILLHEQRTGERFDVFLMHDAEDVVHPYGLKTVNWFIEDNGMIQMPVLSMDRQWNKLVACHYMDEFAEFHTKDLPIRSLLSGMTPSAGVATAFSRSAMLALLREKNGQPFNTDSLTEDYDVAHRLSALGYPSEFIRYHARVPRRRKAWLRKGEVTVRRRELVATKEFFPDKFATSVRQKTRWMLGISYLGWKQLGWFGDLANRYYLFRDRKALFTSPVGAIAYLIVIQVLGYWGIAAIWPQVARLPPLIDQPWVWTLVFINFFFLVNRILHRAWFTGINHGLKHVPLTPVRIVVSNLIGFGAFGRSLRQYVSHLITGRTIAWDKTQHSYPSLSELERGGRIGDVLRFWNHLGEEDLDRALAAQKASYRPIGLQLLDLGLVDDEHLAEAFAERGEVYASIFDPFQIEPGVRALLDADQAAWFGAAPLRRQNGTLDVALAEPLPAGKRAELEKLLGAGGVKSVRYLYAPLSDLAFAVRFGWDEQAFAVGRADLARIRAQGRISASDEAALWRSIRARYVRLGDLLVRAGAISHDSLQTALARGRGLPGRLGDQLVSAGLITAEQRDGALALQVSADWVGARLAAEVARAAEAEPARYAYLSPDSLADAV
ncbi:MAG: glycosyl transferase family protein [Caulobacter sp.]|nr:glycosyl transferase family protein [Caulobacter sp.]